MSDSVRPQRQQPTRLHLPWDSPDKNIGVGCHFLLQCMKVKSESEITQSCRTLHDPMDCSLPGSSIHGIFQARVLELVATAFSDKESWAPKNWCFWTVVLEKTLESPLDCEEIQPVHPKGDQSWVFIGRTDVVCCSPWGWHNWVAELNWPRIESWAPWGRSKEF